MPTGCSEPFDFLLFVKPHDHFLNSPVELPEWLRALQQAISDKEAESPIHVLPPIAVMDELISLAASAPPEAPEDRLSFQRDVTESLDSLGPDLQVEMRTALHDFRRDTVSRLPELLAAAEGMEVAVASAQVFKTRLASAASVKAAWRDTVAIFADEKARYELCLSRLRVLRDLVEARGHAWETEAERVIWVIADSAPHAREMGADIPLPPKPKDGKRQIIIEEKPVGLLESDRLSLIEANLARPATTEDVVVWLRIDDAVVRDGVIEVGPVRFVDSRRLRSRVLVAPQCFRDLGLPKGMEARVASELMSELDEDAQTVFARVETTGAEANAVAWARTAVSGLLDIATLGETRPGWELARGHYVASRRGISFEFYEPNSTEPRGFFQRVIYRPDLRLAEVDKQLVSAWAEGKVEAEKAIDLARWERALSISTDESFRVALGVRNLERVLPSSRVVSTGGRSAHWTKVVSYYLKDAWCWESLREELQEVTFQSVSPAMRPLRWTNGEVEKDDRIEVFYRRLREIVGNESPSPDQLVEYAAAIADLMPIGSTRRRILDRVAENTETQQAGLGWLSELGLRFDRFLARAARQRNATVHGSETVPAVIATVSPFVSGLGKRVVEGALNGAAHEELLAVWFEKVRLEAREKTTALEAGKRLAEIVRQSD